MSSVANRTFQIVSHTHPDWDRYVRDHPKGMIFHTSSMLHAYASAHGIEPYARAAVSDNQRIIALLVSYHISTLKVFVPMVSRSVLFAEPLCDSNSRGLEALINLIKLHDQSMSSRALYCEVRSIGEPGMEKNALLANGYQHHDYINFVIDLNTDVDLLWQNLRKKLRQKIRATLRRGVVIQDDNSGSGIDRLHALLQASYQRARIPLPDQSLFVATLKCLPKDSLRIRTAFIGQRPVASVISLIFKDRVFSWYGGTVRLHGLSPFACIIWEDIAWACKQGYRHYDFGGAGWPDEDYGPRDFKARFGGREVRYGRYTLTYSNLRLRVAELGFDLSRRLGVWS